MKKSSVMSKEIKPKNCIVKNHVHGTNNKKKERMNQEQKYPFNELWFWLNLATINFGFHEGERNDEKNA